MKRFLINVFLLFSTASLAQQLQYNDQHLGKWMSFRSNTWLTKNVALYAERNYRHYKVFPSIEQFAFRVGLFYRSDSSHFLFGGGYASLKNIAPTDATPQVYQSEMRLWQHVSFSASKGRSLYDFRYRIEERLINDKDFYFRHRVRFQNTIPINSKVLQKNSIFFQGDVELFINGQENYFDRVRYNLALGWMMSANIQVLAGFAHELNATYNRKYFAFTFAYDVDLSSHLKKNKG